MFGQSSEGFRNLPLLSHMIILSASMVVVVSGGCAVAVGSTDSCFLYWHGCILMVCGVLR